MTGVEHAKLAIADRNAIHPSSVIVPYGLTCSFIVLGGGQELRGLIEADIGLASHHTRRPTSMSGAEIADLSTFFREGSGDGALSNAKAHEEQGDFSHLRPPRRRCRRGPHWQGLCLLRPTGSALSRMPAVGLPRAAWRHCVVEWKAAFPNQGRPTPPSGRREGLNGFPAGLCHDRDGKARR